MFYTEELESAVRNNHSLRSNTVIIAEWNINDAEHIEQVGNYRYRHAKDERTSKTSTWPHKNIEDTWDESDVGNSWTNATNCDVEIEGPYDENEQGDPIPTLFQQEDLRFKFNYSLDDCFSQHRPRSGVNYPLYFSDRSFDGLNSVYRPRYYLGHRENKFKYWTSFRYVAGDDGIDRTSSFPLQQTMGLSKDEDESVGGYYIHDAAPFVVYDQEYPTNNIVVKMQSNMSDPDNKTFPDPFIRSNSSLPYTWRVEKLNDENTWETIKDFSETDEPVPWDGYVEINYGIILDWPTDPGYSPKPDDFRFLGYFDNESLVPEYGVDGDYYVVLDGGKGTCYAWMGKTDTGIAENFLYSFEEVSFSYNWYVGRDKNVGEVSMSDFTSPSSYDESGETIYRDFQYLKGLRIVVDTMIARNKPFDLIELSPRLVADITDRVSNASVEKAVGVVDALAIPIGGFQPGTGSLTLLDYDMSFSPANENSVIKDLLDRNTSFYIYDNIQVGYKNNYVPIKKLYNEFRMPDIAQYNVNYSLRDAFYRFENLEAPEIMLVDVGLSYAVGTILDLVGHTNYVFKRLDDEPEPTIPYFYVNPDNTLAEVLEKLAVATQSAMFFDEYNNFVVMYKEYLFSLNNRSDESDSVDNKFVYFCGDEPEKDEWDVREAAYEVADRNLQDIVSDESFPDILPNIIEVASDEKKVYNQGTIKYTTRHLERSVASLSTAEKLNADQNWQYKPALLWEVSASEAVRTINELVTQQSAYALGAMPLENSLSNVAPTVDESGEVINNIMNFGDNVYWLPRYNGYLYAGGEIIKFDAMEYVISYQDEDQIFTDTVWITSAQEYQKYFVKTPFNGKMYPTGRVRIWTELEYDESDNASMNKHGRAQFSTEITSHSAGIDDFWTDNDNCSGFYADFYDEFIDCAVDEEGELIDEDCPPGLPEDDQGEVEKVNWNPKSSVRRGYIKNFARDVVDSAADDRSLPLSERGMIQASALYFKGPTVKRGSQKDSHAQSAITFVRKQIPSAPYKHFGTRMRIVGDYEDAAQVPGTDDDSATWQYGGQVLKTASGGIGFGVDSNGNGYYLELRALGYENPDADEADSVSIQQVDNVILWKKTGGLAHDGGSDAPISSNNITKLAGGFYDIKVDSGDFVGQNRLAGEETATTVYDIAVEFYSLRNGYRRFFVYINGSEAFVVDDKTPQFMHNSIAPFVRGSSTVMFENLYALEQNITLNREGTVIANISDTFGFNTVNQNGLGLDASEFFKYGISSFVQQSYLSGVNAINGPDYNIYYEEFGTIMREAAYFDIKYNSYPALISQISPTLNKLPGFKTSGFQAGPYRAKFLVFNVMDKAISLDETSGNYLRIQGVTFTQNTVKEFSMDDFLNKVATPEFEFSNFNYKTKFADIKKNRSKYGSVAWQIETDYLQDEGAANILMKWLTDKTTRPRQLVGLKIFHNPLVQLGDRVKVKYSRNSRDWADPDDSDNNVEVVCDAEKVFVVYNIKYERGGNNSMEVYLSEV